MTKMATMARNRKNQKAYDFETWHEASGGGALQVFINHSLGMTLTSFMARSPMHLNGENS